MKNLGKKIVNWVKKVIPIAKKVGMVVKNTVALPTWEPSALLLAERSVTQSESQVKSLEVLLTRHSPSQTRSMTGFHMNETSKHIND